MTRSPRSASTGIALALAGTLALSSLASAQCMEEPILQNQVGGGSTACTCFVPGEEFGAVFANIPPADYPIEILRIGFGWGSQAGGQGQTLEDSLHIYNGGLPNPGAPIFSLDGPVLTDGFINEFDLTTQGGPVTVNSGPVSVTLRFANTTASAGPFVPTAVHDGAGCGFGRNLVKAIPGGWFDACFLGVSGNWVVTMVYRKTDCGGGGLGTPFCFGTGCPCGNDDPTAGCINSTGAGALLTATGTTSVSADDLVLTASGFAPNNSGLYFMGTSTFPGVIVDDGLACTGGLFRFLPSTVSFGGTFSLTGVVAQSLPGQIPAGSTRHFQAWTRDVLCGPPPAPCPSPCGQNSNLSNGYSVLFTP